MDLDPNQTDFDRFLAEEPDEPVVMLNLLRFADGGAETYARYVAAARPLVEERGGEVLYAGDVGSPLVGPDDEPWHAVMLVRYPSRSTLVEMLKSPQYQATAPLRRAALTSTVLAPTLPWKITT